MADARQLNRLIHYEKDGSAELLESSGYSEKLKSKGGWRSTRFPPLVFTQAISRTTEPSLQVVSKDLLLKSRKSVAKFLIYDVETCLPAHKEL
jgi:hypothetical protein